MTSAILEQENVWFNKSTYDKAECLYFEKLAKVDGIGIGIYENSLQCAKNINKTETRNLGNIVQDVENILKKLDVQGTEKEIKKVQTMCNNQNNQKPNLNNVQDDDDLNLFESDSDDDDVEAAKIREERVAAYEQKKSKKPTVTAKSSIILDVKPWDDQTDMKVMEGEVRKIQKDGLLWGAAKLVPVAYKIQKLQISCVVEDEKISVDWLTDQIQEIEDFVQSVDIAAFNKI